jgi:hypothetical protein
MLEIIMIKIGLTLKQKNQTKKNVKLKIGLNPAFP